MVLCHVLVILQYVTVFSLLLCFWVFLVAQMARNLPIIQETQIRFLGAEDKADAPGRQGRRHPGSPRPEQAPGPADHRPRPAGSEGQVNVPVSRPESARNPRRKAGVF